MNWSCRKVYTATGDYSEIWEIRKTDDGWWSVYTGFGYDTCFPTLDDAKAYCEEENKKGQLS